jgi:hypothetical protein
MMKKISVILIILIMILTILSGCTDKDTDDDNDLVEDTDGNNGSTTKYSHEYVAENVWGSVPAITLDSNDIPHLSFYGRQYGDLYYATKVDDNWAYEIVDAEGDVGTEKGIAVEEDGTVHIAYKDTTNGDTKYAVKQGGSWDISVLEVVPNTHHTVYVDLELDSQNNPHVIYHTEGNEEYDGPNMSIVKYAILENEIWDIEIIAPIGQFTELELDSNDQPHILYVIEPESTTIHAYKENGEWIHHNIDPESANRRDVNIEIDENNGIHIIYHETDEGLIKYYYKDPEGNENIETVDSGLSTEGFGYKGIKLGLDPDGVPHVVYFSHSRDGFVHAIKDGDEWTYEIIDDGGYPSIVIDSQGNAHIAHTCCMDVSWELGPDVVERDDEGVEQIVYHLISK